VVRYTALTSTRIVKLSYFIVVGRSSLGLYLVVNRAKKYHLQ
jgi:hypothetical protein